MTPSPIRTALVLGCLIACTSGISPNAQTRELAGSGEPGDWITHNRDPYGTRFSPLSEINTANVGTLTKAWTFEQTGVGELTPVAVNGVVYFGIGSKVVAVDGATGKTRWATDVQPSSTGGRRGPVYAGGTIYSYSTDTIYAVNATTGEPVRSFGDNGALRIINRAVEFKYPGQYPPDLKPDSVGWSIATPPRVHGELLILGTSDSDSLIKGGLVIAAEVTTGKIRWVFTTVPQGPQDDGWEIAKDTWESGYRRGGGIWTQPAVDADAGLLYFNVANPAPDYDGSARKGTNLFTDSTVALHLSSGKLAWHFQTVHHDIWDRDAVAGPILFDVTIGGRTVKAIGTGSKTCFTYFWDRISGQPLHPIVETPVPTATDVPGEQPWPTQPVPYTAAGIPATPFCATYPIVADSTLKDRVRPMFHPYQAKELVIISPGLMGGANFGPPSYSPRTGFFYVSGKNDAYSIRVNPTGNTLQAAAGSRGYYDNIKETGPSGVKATTNVVAQDPATGAQVWAAVVPGATNGGSLVTAGDVVFQGAGTGELYAFDARTGRQLLKVATGARSLSASPLTYSAGGKQFVAIGTGNAVVALALP